MRRRPVPTALVVVATIAVAAGALCACTARGGATQPSASSTPPPVETTVAVGVTRHAGRAAPARPAGRPSIVPNGTGPHAVAAPDVDGCNRAYGLVSQCVPMHAPGGGPVTCAFLRTYHYLPLRVTEDPLGLLRHGTASVRLRGGTRYITGCST